MGQIWERFTAQVHWWCADTLVLALAHKEHHTHLTPLYWFVWIKKLHRFRVPKPIESHNTAACNECNGTTILTMAGQSTEEQSLSALVYSLSPGTHCKSCFKSNHAHKHASWYKFNRLSKQLTSQMYQEACLWASWLLQKHVLQYTSFMLQLLHRPYRQMYINDRLHENMNPLKGSPLSNLAQSKLCQQSTFCKQPYRENLSE